MTQTRLKFINFCHFILLFFTWCLVFFSPQISFSSDLTCESILTPHVEKHRRNLLLLNPYDFFISEQKAFFQKPQAYETVKAIDPAYYPQILKRLSNIYPKHSTVTLVSNIKQAEIFAEALRHLTPKEEVEFTSAKLRFAEEVKSDFESGDFQHLVVTEILPEDTFLNKATVLVDLRDQRTDFERQMFSDYLSNTSNNSFREVILIHDPYLDETERIWQRNTQTQVKQDLLQISQPVIKRDRTTRNRTPREKNVFDLRLQDQKRYDRLNEYIFSHRNESIAMKVLPPASHPDGLGKWLNKRKVHYPLDWWKPLPAETILLLQERKLTQNLVRKGDDIFKEFESLFFASEGPKPTKVFLEFLTKENNTRNRFVYWIYRLKKANPNSWWKIFHPEIQIYFQSVGAIKESPDIT